MTEKISEKQQNERKEMVIVAISGINFPSKSRSYLINLVKEVVVDSKAKFVTVAGHTIDGKHLETEFKSRLKDYISDECEKSKENGTSFNYDWAKHDFEQMFIEEYASHLSDFLPVLPNNVSWHIVIAERIYDRPLGARILEKLKDMRNDVRIIGNRLEDGFYDREPKFPVQFFGRDIIMRVIVPHRSPWFSRNISNLLQKLHSTFSPRTLSPKPDFIITGVTGTSVHLPYYDGVPNISVPALNKLLEQQSTEHMIGATVIKLVADDKGMRVINGVHNFRIAAFQEKTLAIPSSLPKAQQTIMRALVPSDASFKAIMHRTNANKRIFGYRTDFKEETVKKILAQLIITKQVVFSKKSNRYGINEALRRNASITLAHLHKDARKIKHVVWSCFHGGALKTLYFTALEDLPKMLADADAGIENGDLIQGNAHNYDYNGELLPGLNTVDKQEILNAHIRAYILIEAFKIRLKTNLSLFKNTKETVEKSFVPYRFNIGNHDAWRHWGKVGLILQQFEDTLRNVLIKNIVSVCRENNIPYSETEARALINKKVKRIGESRMTDIDGVLVGAKHPYKSRTVTKSTRIQEVVDFIWRRFESFINTVAKNSKGFAIAYVANFHEAAAAHVTKYGQTFLGVMTGAYLHDTEFETNMDKVVDRGPAVVTAILSPNGELLYSETEFIPRINKEDIEFVTADRLDSKQVYERVIKLFDKIKLDLPWR